MTRPRETVVLVTGGSAGIGRATVTRLAEGGDGADRVAPAAPAGRRPGARAGRRRRGLLGGRVDADPAADGLLRDEGGGRRVREGAAPGGDRARDAGAHGEPV